MPNAKILLELPGVEAGSKECGECEQRTLYREWACDCFDRITLMANEWDEPLRCPACLAAEVKLAESRKVKQEDLKRPITGGSIPPSGSMTDEEALLSLRTAACSPLCPGYDNQSCPECYKGKAMDHLRARLAQKPKVTREQARGLVLALETFCRESGIPTDRVKELNVPQVFLDILGLEVEEEK